MQGEYVVQFWDDNDPELRVVEETWYITGTRVFRNFDGDWLPRMGDQKLIPQRREFYKEGSNVKALYRMYTWMSIVYVCQIEKLEP